MAGLGAAPVLASGAGVAIGVSAGFCAASSVPFTASSIFCLAASSSALPKSSALAELIKKPAVSKPAENNKPINSLDMTLFFIIWLLSSKPFYWRLNHQPPHNFVHHWLMFGSFPFFSFLLR